MHTIICTAKVRSMSVSMSMSMSMSGELHGTIQYHGFANHALAGSMLEPRHLPAFHCPPGVQPAKTGWWLCYHVPKV